MRLICLFVLALQVALVPVASSETAAPQTPGPTLRVQFLIVGEWENLPLRMYMRRSWELCSPVDSADVVVERHFLMNQATLPDGDFQDLVREEIEKYGDMLVLGGGDSMDEARPGSALHVLQRPSSRVARFLQGCQWLLDRRPDFDLLIVQEETTFLHLRRLLEHVHANWDYRLIVGSIQKETPLTGARGVDEESCEMCPLEAELQTVCLDRAKTSPGGLDYWGCVAAAKACCPNLEGLVGAGCSKDEMFACVEKARLEGVQAAIYYGAAAAQPWPQSAAWSVGKGVVEFLAANRYELKMRGDLSFLVGFWLAGLEDVKFVDLPSNLFFQSAPTPVESERLGVCPVRSAIVVGNVSADDWSSSFDASRCEWGCSWQ